MKIVIFVDGGNVQGVYSTSLNVEVELIDFDNLRAEGRDEDARHRTLGEAIETLHCVF